MDFSLVIFDFDGTVVDSEEGIANCVRYALASVGIEEMDDAKVRKFIGPPLYESFRDLYGFDADIAFRLVEKYRERYRPVGYRECRVYDGMLDLLDALRANGVKTAVASAKPQDFVIKICEELGFAQKFDAIIGSRLSDTGSDKTRLLKKAVESVGVLPPPGAVAMVGDSKYDILAAKKIGAYAVGVEYGFGTKEEFVHAGADRIVKTVTDLRSLLLP